MCAYILPSDKLRREALSLVKNINIAQSRRLRFKELGQRQRPCFINGALFDYLLRRQDQGRALVAFTVRLGPWVLNRYNTPIHSFDHEAFKDDVARSFASMQPDASNPESRLAYFWYAIEEKEKKKGEIVDPHLHGTAIIRRERLKEFKDTFDKIGQFSAQPSVGTKPKVLETAVDAFQWGVYATKFPEATYLSQPLNKSGQDLWKRHLKTPPGGASVPWLSEATYAKAPKKPSVSGSV